MTSIPKPHCTLDAIFDFYLKSKAFSKLSPTTQKDYERKLHHVSSTVVEGKRLGDYRCNKIKVRHLTQAYDIWLDTGIRTANYRKACLSCAWKHAMRHDVFIHDPVALVKTVASGQRRVYWTDDQIDTFTAMAYSDFRWRSIGLIVHMAYDWGQRVGDMRLLQWSTLDLDQCTMDLTQSKRNAEIHLPISNNLCKMLRQQKEEWGFQEYVAPRVMPRAGAYPPYNVEEISPLINEVLSAGGLPMHLTAMDLRRTAVKEIMEGGGDLLTTIQVTGHKNIASLKNYQVNTRSGAAKALAVRGRKDE